MLIVLALGGNALLRRGEPMNPDVQLENIRDACDAIAPLAARHRLVITHGNGPQVGLLALHDSGTDQFPLDVHGAESEGMIGYLLARELRSRLAPDREVAAVLTMVEVDPHDAAFTHPTKPIGPVYQADDARRLASKHRWTVKADGPGVRRVVASPSPQRIVELAPIRWLLDRQCVVICAGGGGIPVVADDSGVLQGVAAVVDKDLASCLLATDLNADLFVMATDVDGVYTEWGTVRQKLLRHADPSRLRHLAFSEGSMAPKVEAACRFVERTGRVAAIGSLNELEAVIAGDSGTSIQPRGPVLIPA